MGANDEYIDQFIVYLINRIHIESDRSGSSFYTLARV